MQNFKDVDPIKYKNARRINDSLEYELQKPCKVRQLQ